VRPELVITLGEEASISRVHGRPPVDMTALSVSPSGATRGVLVGRVAFPFTVLALAAPERPQFVAESSRKTADGWLSPFSVVRAILERP